MFKLFDRWASQGEQHLNHKFSRIHRALLIPTIVTLLVAIAYAGAIINTTPIGEPIPWAMLAPAVKLFAAAFAWQIVTVGTLLLIFHVWSMVSPVARSMKRVQEHHWFA